MTQPGRTPFQFVDRDDTVPSYPLSFSIPPFAPGEAPALGVKVYMDGNNEEETWTQLVYGTQWTLYVTSTGGSVTILNPTTLPEWDKAYIYADEAFARNNESPNNYSATAVNNELDHLTRLIQQLTGRMIRVEARPYPGTIFPPNEPGTITMVFAHNDLQGSNLRQDTTGNITCSATMLTAQAITVTALDATNITSDTITSPDIRATGKMSLDNVPFTFDIVDLEAGDLLGVLADAEGNWVITNTAAPDVTFPVEITVTPTYLALGAEGSKLVNASIIETDNIISMTKPVAIPSLATSDLSVGVSLTLSGIVNIAGYDIGFDITDLTEGQVLAFKMGMTRQWHMYNTDVASNFNLTQGFVPIANDTSVLVNSSLFETDEEMVAEKPVFVPVLGLDTSNFTLTQEAAERLTSNQKLIWDVNLDSLPVNSYAALYLRIVSADTARIVAMNPISSSLVVKLPWIDHAPAVWVGHAGELTARELYSGPAGFMGDNAFSDMSIATVVSTQTLYSTDNIIDASGVVDIDAANGDFFIIRYDQAITSINVTNLAENTSITLDFINTGSVGTTINWPTTWSWLPYNRAPNAALFGTGIGNPILIERYSFGIIATSVKLNMVSMGRTLTVAQPWTDHAAAVWVGTGGALLKSGSVMTMQGNTISGASIKNLITSTRSGQLVQVTGADLILDLDTGYDFYFVHDVDITSITVTGRLEGIISLCRVAGASTQTAIPLPDDWFAQTRVWNVSAAEDSFLTLTVYTNWLVICQFGWGTVT